jgi:hypothetical protein
MTAPDQSQQGAQLAMGGSDRGEVTALVLLALAFAGWVAAFISFGEGRMWFFGALAAVLTMAALALMRPAQPQSSASGS